MNNHANAGTGRKPDWPSILRNARGAVRELAPGNFAMVMATGIVSIAAQAMGMAGIARALFWLNMGVYLVLWILSVLRAAWFPRDFIGDLFDHQRGPGFLTMVAGSCVLGSQFVILSGNYAAAFVLWVIGVLLWLGLNYATFAAFTIKANKPPLEQGLDGRWLLAVVAPQSVAVLGVLLAAQAGDARKDVLDFAALALWLFGGMLYIWLMALIFYRFTFFKLSPEQLTPPYWINMGATAISTLAGSLLVINAPRAPLLQSLLPFLKGFTLLYWAAGTWWIPVLLLLGAWRHLYRRVPLRYDPAYWGAVFPLGMYAAGTLQMERAMSLPFLDFIPRVFLYAALLAWLAASFGLVYALTRRAMAWAKP